MADTWHQHFAASPFARSTGHIDKQAAYKHMSTIPGVVLTDDKCTVTILTNSNPTELSLGFGEKLSNGELSPDNELGVQFRIAMACALYNAPTVLMANQLQELINDAATKPEFRFAKVKKFIKPGYLGIISVEDGGEKVITQIPGNWSFLKDDFRAAGPRQAFLLLFMLCCRHNGQNNMAMIEKHF